MRFKDDDKKDEPPPPPPYMFEFNNKSLRRMVKTQFKDSKC